ncbi:gluconate 2-dehydrogenase subunit 3 family protein [Mycobacterium sp.]|uniref:gluconate 2-dehydrogenase subunit 3 family protein n=1 Tax=Mycobacterium sp. TaxID=1785 RepID=UPI003BAE53F7
MASDGAVPGYGLSAPVSRRRMLGGLTLLPLVAVSSAVPTASADPGDTATAADAADTSYLYLSPHQAAVLDAATRRLIPGPGDDPGVTTPGAHEANVVRYIDVMLGAFSFSPAKVHAGGPWSNRAGGSVDFMANFVPLDRAQNYAWQQRIANLRSQYTAGIALLDQLAGGDFTTESKSKQNNILATGQAVSFTQVLFGHAIEGMYSVPEYGGNANLVGWQGIAWPGDIEPRGYTDAEVEAAQGDTAAQSGIIGMLVQGGWALAIAKMGGKAGVNIGR